MLWLAVGGEVWQWIQCEFLPCYLNASLNERTWAVGLVVGCKVHLWELNHSRLLLLLLWLLLHNTELLLRKDLWKLLVKLLLILWRGWLNVSETKRFWSQSTTLRIQHTCRLILRRLLKGLPMHHDSWWRRLHLHLELLILNLLLALVGANMKIKIWLHLNLNLLWCWVVSV